MAMSSVLLKETSGSYKWSADNWPLTFTNWGDQEPSSEKGCVASVFSKGWQSVDCFNPIRATICRSKEGMWNFSSAFWNMLELFGLGGFKNVYANQIGPLTLCPPHLYIKRLMHCNWHMVMVFWVCFFVNYLIAQQFNLHFLQFASFPFCIFLSTFAFAYPSPHSKCLKTCKMLLQN